MAKLRYGRYVITDEIGSTGQTVICKAFDPKIERHLIIKTICPPSGSSKEGLDDFRRRFDKERIALGRLSHPSIATIYDAGEEDGEFYIAREYVDGENLGQLMKMEGAPFPLRRHFKILQQLADALDHAHDKGVIHRNLRPESILVARQEGSTTEDPPESDDRVKLIDFDLALIEKMADGETAFSPAKVGYSSPENLLGRPGNEASDVFSLGVIAYQMLCGVLPFRKVDEKSVKDRIIDDSFTPLPQSIPESAGFNEILGKALAKDPRQRYPNCRNMMLDISALLKEHLKEPAKMLVFMAASARWVKTHKAASALVAILLILLSSLPFAYFYFIVLPEREVNLKSLLEEAQISFHNDRLAPWQPIDSTDPGKMQDAITAVDQALQIDPNHIDARSLRNNILSKLIEAGQKMPPNNAVQHYSKVRELFREDPIALQSLEAALEALSLQNKAERYLQQKEFALAKEHLEELLKNYDWISDYHVMKAHAQRGLGELDEARKSMEKAEALGGSSLYTRGEITREILAIKLSQLAPELSPCEVRVRRLGSDPPGLMDKLSRNPHGRLEFNDSELTITLENGSRDSIKYSEITNAGLKNDILEIWGLGVGKTEVRLLDRSKLSRFRTFVHLVDQLN